VFKGVRQRWERDVVVDEDLMAVDEDASEFEDNCEVSRIVPFGHVFGPLLSSFRTKFTRYSSHSARKQQKQCITR
jgi:hypothetical protein